MRKWCVAVVVWLGFAAAAAASDWGYTGAEGPEHWGELAPEFATCETGRLQSPFDIRADITADLSPIVFNYGRVALYVENTGHTLQVNTASENRIEVDRVSYELLQFHFHTPSEHLIAGERFPMALHLVHRSAEGAYAVVGVMLDYGDENPAIAALWTAASPEPGESRADGLADLNDLLPVDRRYYRFMGSLTTPPCTEGINWHMMAEPVTVSRAQVAAFQAIFPMNARPLQPENNRLVVSAR